MYELKRNLQNVFELQKRHQHVVKQTTAQERKEKLEKLKAAILGKVPELIDAMQQDFGKPSFEVVALEVMTVIGDLDNIIKNLDQWMEPVEVVSSSVGAKAKIISEPKGQCLIFSAWNFPFMLLFSPLAAAVGAGNVCTLKPSEITPATSSIAAQIVSEVFDESEVVIIEGGVDVAKTLLELPFNHIFFTGSTNVGREVMQAAGKHLASVTLELGGKCPVVIDENVDLEKIVPRIAFGKFLNAGQVCLTPDHVWIKESRKEEFVRKMEEYIQQSYYEQGNLNKADLSKIVNKRNLNRLQGLVEDAVLKGASIQCGGITDGQTFHPTVLTDVPLDSKIMEEEIFGPILPVLVYKNLDEVIDQINSRPKPLALYVFSENQHVVDTILSRTSSGGATVNDVIQHCMEHNLPFGGVNESGIGRYHGIFGFKEFSHERGVLYQAPVGTNPMENFAHAPYKGKLEMLLQQMT
ncbi:aldehyde dehydrogenase [Bacillus sp. AFS002410]|uniref:aldehyde dehydrogenase family protein n=1 Tax=Bacillus sp. AFS002410 TaxID=2033481 RepID=UPI000BF1A216|nr:aldehyde dehydrogenase family protein [Bacillus sp. AFS002410]PEJ60850.1 aldehyde dehydrogenase [Bacillus sp. AFS002410]